MYLGPIAAGVGLGHPLTGAIAELGAVHAAFWFGAGVPAVPPGC